MDTCLMEYDEEYVSWITWFCEFKGNEFFCMVDREFIADDFNLTGLSSMVSFYHYALELILDVESFDGDRLTEEQKRIVESSAETLYGLIHARFITTSRGLKLMEEKFLNGDFGGCPRVFCGGQPVLPVGQSDVIRESSVKLFCPKCEDIYYPRSTRHKTLDGAFWGTTFPHLLLMQMRESGKMIPKPTQQYVPRIYGFRIRKPGAEPSLQVLADNAANARADAAIARSQNRHTAPQSEQTGSGRGTAQLAGQDDGKRTTTAPDGTAANEESSQQKQQQDTAAAANVETAQVPEQP